MKIQNDAEFVNELNTRIRKHPSSFAGAMTSDVLEVHRSAYPIDTHFDPISARYQYNQKFDQTYMDPSKGSWSQRVFASILRRIAPKGKNRPFTGQITKQGFDNSFGGGISSGHANPNNAFNRLAGDPWERIVGEYEFLTELVQSDPHYVFCRSPEAVIQAKRDKKKALMFAVEGAHALSYLPDRSLSKERAEEIRLERLRHLKQVFGGVYLTLDHYCANDMSRASIVTNVLSKWNRRTTRLTNAGKKLVEAAFNLGLLIDLSHSCTESIADVCALAKPRNIPVFASHAGSQEIMRGFEWEASTRTKRMLETEAVFNIVRTGGCISVIFGTQFLENHRYSTSDWKNDAHASVLLEHYERLANLIAATGLSNDPWDHLSFGTDLDGGLASIPWEMENAGHLPLLTQLMLERGWPVERINKVYSGNFLRIWQQAIANSGTEPV